MSYAAPTFSQRSSCGRDRPFLLPQNLATETEPRMIIALNILFATIVIVGIVGMLAWSIVGQDRDAATGLLRRARRRRRTTARAQFIGRSVEHRV